MTVINGEAIEEAIKAITAMVPVIIANRVDKADRF